MRNDMLLIGSVAVLSAALFTGCMGPACALVTHAPLRVVGRIQNSQEQPIADKTMRLVIASSSRQYDAKKTMIDKARSSSSLSEYLFEVESKTDEQGNFAFSIPDRHFTHSAAFIGFIVIGGENANDVYMVISEDASDSPIYMARLHRRRLILNRVNRTTQDLEAISKSGDHPEIAGKAKRFKKEDVVTLTLTVP